MRKSFSHINIKEALASQFNSDANSHESSTWKSPEQIEVPNNMDFITEKPAFEGYVAGLPPYLRGPYSTMYAARPWTVRQYAGFSTAAAALVGCEGPVIKSVPYVVQPEQINPGVANYYATTIADGYDFSSIIVKTKERETKRGFNKWNC